MFATLSTVPIFCGSLGTMLIHTTTRRSLLIGHRHGNPTGRGWRNSTGPQTNSANRPVTSFARAFALSLLRAKMRQGRGRHDSGRGRCVSDLRSSGDRCRRCTDRLDAWLRNPDGNLRPRRTHALMTRKMTRKIGPILREIVPATSWNASRRYDRSLKFRMEVNAELGSQRRLQCCGRGNVSAGPLADRVRLCVADRSLRTSPSAHRSALRKSRRAPNAPC
jgi:hypothetical protein